MSTHSDIHRVFSNARNRINLDLAEFEREFRAATEDIEEMENFSKINNSLTEMYADVLPNMNESELMASKIRQSQTPGSCSREVDNSAT